MHHLEHGQPLTRASAMCPHVLVPAAPTEYGPYDAVVVATPLLTSGIALSLGGEACRVGLTRGKDTDAHDGTTPQGTTASTWCQAANLDRPYQVTVTTWVAGGRLRPSYFGVRKLPAVRAVLVTDSAEVPFSSISGRRVGAGNSSQLVFKVGVNPAASSGASIP